MKNWLPYFFLLLPFTVCAQTDYQERLYLHTDRTTYVTGETIWFSAYLLDATTNRLSNLSRQFYVELISVDNKPVLQQTVALRGGRGASSMQITDPLPTGRYQLRAYTNWMKNFAIRNFFTQEIIVLNPFVANKDSVSSSAPAIASNENTNKLTDFPLRLSTERLGRRQPLTISFETCRQPHRWLLHGLISCLRPNLFLSTMLVLFLSTMLASSPPNPLVRSSITCQKWKGRCWRVTWWTKQQGIG
ncbi:MAG TPA: hypothetical protein PLQ32_05920 [Flavihumibacter sp.]|nr:hypothetical protein [Flavihumibacter sp.]